MSRTFTTATDDGLIGLIEGAQNRLAVIAPALTTPVATALAARLADLLRGHWAIEICQADCACGM